MVYETQFAFCLLIDTNFMCGIDVVLSLVISLLSYAHPYTDSSKQELGKMLEGKWYNTFVLQVAITIDEFSKNNGQCATRTDWKINQSTAGTNSLPLNWLSGFCALSCETRDLDHQVLRLFFDGHRYGVDR